MQTTTDVDIQFEEIIPFEILLIILSYLSGQALFRSAQVDIRWYVAVYGMDEAILYRRFPETYKKLRPNERRNLRDIEKKAYYYLKQPAISLMNACKDRDDKTITDLIRNDSVQFNDLFSIDQCDMNIPFNIISARGSQEVRREVYERMVRPLFRGTLELLLWAIRLRVSQEKVEELWEAERREMQHLIIPALLQSFLTRRTLDLTLRSVYRKQQGVEKDRTPLLEACLYENVEAVDFLVRKGEDVHQVDESGDTPLLEACRWGNLNIVDYLLENGARKDVNRANKFGCSPLSETVRWEYTEIVVLLINNGADATLLDKKNQSNMLTLFRTRGRSVESALVEKMLETYLHRKRVDGKLAARCLLNALRKKNKENLDMVHRFHRVLTEASLNIIYELSKPLLDAICRASDEPSSRRVIWVRK